MSPGISAVIRSLALFAAAGLAASISSCDQSPLGGEAPRSEIFVLVDLSETWHNAQDDTPRNARILAEIGEGIAIAAENAEPPILVQYRIIGAQSLGREPICNVTYVPTLVGGGGLDPSRVTSLRKLRAYVGADCPRLLIAQPAEPTTEITAAIASVSSKPQPKGTKRYLIIASDFLEEATAPEPLPAEALVGTKALLLYRPVSSDRLRGGELASRMDAWKTKFQDVGAVVTSMPDGGIGRSDVSSFLE